MYWKRASCTAMTFLCRCWRRAMARPRPDACGPMCGTIVRPEIQQLRRYGSPTRRIARENIRNNI